MKKNSLRYVYCIVPVVVVAALGSLFVGMGMEWYKSLNKPSEWPANALIPIMWTIIYLIVIVLLLLITKKGKVSKKTLILLSINGLINVLWCLLFFTGHKLLLGQVLIIANLVAAYMLDYEMFEYKPEYGYALLVYPLWVSIATSLNLVLLALN